MESDDVAALLAAVADAATLLRGPPDTATLTEALRVAGQAGLTGAGVVDAQDNVRACWGDRRAVLDVHTDTDDAMVGPLPDQQRLVLAGAPFREEVWRAFGSAMLSCFTQALRAEERLTRAEEDFRGFIENAPDAIAIHRDGLVLYANPAWLGPNGAETASEVLGTPVLSWFLEQDRELAALQLSSGDQSVEVRSAHNPDRWVELAVPSRVRFMGERAQLLVARDVTERRSMQEQLMVTDRMATIGLLAAGVAHEINNPLAAIVANVAVAARQVRERMDRADTYSWLDELYAELDDARLAADQVRGIIRDLRMFSRGPDEPSEVVDVRRVMDSSLKMAASALGRNTRIEREYHDIPAVVGTTSRIGQVFLNLLVNAAQALQGDQPRAVRDDCIRIRICVEGEMVCVEVQDTGPGVAPEVLPRLFQPFVSTKPRGEGTGLGLSICQRIVTDLGGNITVVSTPGSGATFRVALRPAEAPCTSRSATPPPSPSRRRGRVLIIDDEPLIGRAVGRMLRRDHDVVAITAGAEALRTLARDQDWDLILLDLMMPGLSGQDVYERLERDFPRLLGRVVLVTGGTFTERGRQFLERVPNPSLEKPFDERALRRLLDDSLQG